MHSNQQSDGSFTTSFSSTSTTSLLSKLDRLDSMTTYLEQKSDLSRCSTNSEVGMVQKEMVPVPLDLAVKEAQSRGSLLDRVASLEDRLLQLCLIIESKAATPSKGSGMQQPFPYTNFLSESRKASFSLSRLRPSLRKDKETSQGLDKYQVKEQEEDPKLTSNEGYMSKRTKKCTSKRAAMKGKKESPSSWPHFKLLGC